MLRLLLTTLVVVSTVATASAASIGQARIAKFAPSAFDKYTRSPDAAAQLWMRDHYARMLVFSPYWDSRLSWYTNGWAYKDLYGVPTGSAFANAHPDWILRDAAGRALYLRFACSGGTCPQLAGDIGNPAFRADWIATAGPMLAKGYVGLLIDDVNMRIDRVSDGNGTAVAPRDPRTGTTMTEADWRRYMAEFTEQIRNAFPSKEIVHNALWFAPLSDPFVQRQYLASNGFSMERGVNDGGIVKGTGPFGFETFLGVIDWLHERGRWVWLNAGVTTDAEREYALAAYLLIATGNDFVGNTPGAEPDNWWPGYGVDLGAPLGGRTVVNGIFQRDFAEGRVLLNQPGTSQASIQLGGTFLRVDGSAVTSVTLGAARGAVLRRTGGTTATTTTVRPPTTVPTTTSRPTTTTSRASTTTRPTTTSTTTSSPTTTTPPACLPDGDTCAHNYDCCSGKCRGGSNKRCQ